MKIRKCPNCKKENKPDSRFCMVCGAKLMGKKSRTILYVILSILLVLILVFVSLFLFTDIFGSKKDENLNQSNTWDNSSEESSSFANDEEYIYSSKIDFSFDFWNDNSSKNDISSDGSTDNKLYFTDSSGNVIIDFEDIKSVTSGYNATNHQYQVTIELNEEGTQQLAEFTTTHIGEVLNIVLGDQTLSSPIINDAITEGVAIISGDFDAETVISLENLMKSGIE